METAVVRAFGAPLVVEAGPFPGGPHRESRRSTPGRGPGGSLGPVAPPAHGTFPVPPFDTVPNGVSVIAQGPGPRSRPVPVVPRPRDAVPHARARTDPPADAHPHDLLAAPAR